MWSTLLVLLVLTGKPSSSQKDIDKAKSFDCAPKIEKMEKSCDKKCKKKKGPDRAVCQDTCAEGVQAIKDACKEIAKNKGRMGTGGGGGGRGGGSSGGGSESEDVH